MSARVLIADLGMGNLRSVARALERVGVAASVVKDPSAIRDATAVIVPGQGAFRDGANALELGWGNALRDSIARGVPYFGICLGMQLLFDASEESPGKKGMGVFAGDVVRFSDALYDEHGARLKVPHMGWNDVQGAHPFLPANDYFYFVHSFHCVPKDSSCVVGTTNYGAPFVSAISRGALFACQFHPEKSQDAGHEMLTRFVKSWT